MKNLLRVLFIQSAFIISLFSNAQVTPQAEPVYGAYVSTIDAIAMSDTTRVFVATRSPNSMFYTDVLNMSTSPTFTSFTVIPDLDENAEMGFIRDFAVDENSGYIFVMPEDGGIFACDIGASSIYSVDPDYAEAIEAYHGFLFYEKFMGNDEYLYFTSINTDGSIGTISSLLIDSNPGWDNRFKIDILVSPYDDYLYIFVPGGGANGGPFIYKSSDTYDLINTSTTFTQLTITDLTSTGYEYVSMGIGYEGRIYTGSYEGNTSSYETRISFSDSDGDPWTTNIEVEDAGRGEFSISAGSGSSYIAYYSRIVSDDRAANWDMHGGADGTICADPINSDICYLRTDWGIGMYDHSSTSVTEINDGLLAVQVNDFDMSSDKETAWVASKSGLWYVSTYTTSANWSDPIHPDNQPVPLTEVTCSRTADTLYCGNTDANVIRYEGANGDPLDGNNYHEIFSAQDDSPYPNYTWTYHTEVTAIARDTFTGGERIFVGLYDGEDWDETTESYGALFYGYYSGGSWNWEHITGGDFPTSGIDILDVVVTEEGGNVVAYVGVEYNNTSTAILGVYRVEKTTTGWLITRDLLTGPGYVISASILDLHISTNDVIYAVGTNVSGTNATTYEKAIGDTYWTNLTSSGITGGYVGRAITTDDVNNDLYIAVDEDIYVWYSGASSWAPVWTYPNGTEINVLYYDDLLVGTGTGLYMHPHTGVSINKIPKVNKNFEIYPNPSSQYFYIEIADHPNENIQVKIFDISGKHLVSIFNQQTDNSGIAEFNTPNIDKGLYLIQVEYDGRIVSQKLMIE